MARLIETAGGGVKNSSRQRANCNHRNIDFQKRNENKSDECHKYTGHAANGFRSQIERNDNYDSNHCRAGSREKFLNETVSSDLFKIARADQNKHKRWQEHQEGR